MRLKELENEINEIFILNDAEFSNLKMLTTFSDNESLTFINDTKYVKNIIEDNSISAIITTREIFEMENFPKSRGVVITENPKKLFYKIHNYLAETEFYWEHKENNIDSSANISPGAVIGEHSIVIGKNSSIEANVVINSGTIIGENVIIRSGSQIGGPGFQFLNSEQKILNVSSAGRVEILNNVEIKNNSCVDRGVFGGNTLIKEEVKIDNLVHIAHDDVIGERTFITAGVQLGGRVIIGKDCWLGVNATVSNGINIGDNSKVSLGAVVTKDVKDNSTVTGNFAIDHRKFLNFLKTIR